eukprot:291930_1
MSFQQQVYIEDEDDDDIFPKEFNVVVHKRGQQQAGILHNVATDDIIQIVNTINITIQTLGEKKLHQKKAVDDLNQVVTQLKAVTSDGIDETTYSGSMYKISRNVDMRSIVECIGCVYIQRKPKVGKKPVNLSKGTGTVFKKLENGYIVILTCAHNIVDDDGSEAYKIWFSPDPLDTNRKSRLPCIAWYYP